MPFKIGSRNIQNILSAPQDLKKCEGEISKLVAGLENVHNREKSFLEQEKRILEHRAIASELKSATADARPRCKAYRKYTSPWRLSENPRPFVRQKNDQIHITPRKGVKIYWAEKCDRIFNTALTVAPSKYDGGYNQASAKISQLNDYIGERIDGVNKRTPLELLEEISNVNIQHKALDRNEVSMSKHQKALGKQYAKQQKYQEREAIKQEMTKAAFALFIEPGTVDYLNRETDKKPKLADTLKNVSRSDIIQLLNDGFANHPSDSTSTYRYETCLSKKEINLYKNRINDKGSVLIDKFMPVDPAPSASKDSNVVFMIEGTPSEAEADGNRYKVFRHGGRYIPESVNVADDGKTHIHLRQVRSSMSRD
ncbi:hypothetical protein SAMN05216598_1435 [Pseudomonas asplenii]|uniref:Uncharacterized protein n=1 Tax=Pseudomonas asplenii TaxID=53407 RepID=A0A1H1RTD1_9PSED|nr:hypothetical protein [Pseudomonas asplenii]SDS38950.1 hypothetical protein SAMN05216598_1435 [Pseudomonas asplenii]